MVVSAFRSEASLDVAVRWRHSRYKVGRLDDYGHPQIFVCEDGEEDGCFLLAKVDGCVLHGRADQAGLWFFSEREDLPSQPSAKIPNV